MTKNTNIADGLKSLMIALNNSLDKLNDANNFIVSGTLKLIDAMGGEIQMNPNPVFYSCMDGKKYNVTRITSNNGSVLFWDGNNCLNISKDLSVDDFNRIMTSVYIQYSVNEKIDLNDIL